MELKITWGHILPGQQKDPDNNPVALLFKELGADKVTANYNVITFSYKGVAFYIHPSYELRLWMMEFDEKRLSVGMKNFLERVYRV